MPKPCDHDSHEKFELLIGPLREEARRLGYAIGVHGTLKRDIDLIACPWTDSAVSAKELADALQAVARRINGYAEPHPRESDEYFREGCPGAKAHGRRGWTFHLVPANGDVSGGCWGPYIDLSVMPRLGDIKPDGWPHGWPKES